MSPTGWRREARPWSALALTAIGLAFVGWTLRSPDAVRIGLALAAVGTLTCLWAGARGGPLRRHIHRPIVRAGSTTTLRFDLAIPRWPPWFRVTAEQPLPPGLDVGESVRVTLPMAAGPVSLQTVLPAGRRGVFHLEPPTLSMSDPFGLITHRWRGDEGAVLKVAPRVQPLPRDLPAARLLLGEVRARRGWEDAGIAGVREYAPGDSQRRIHWRQSARTGRLQVKEHDHWAGGAVLLVPDLTERRAGPGEDEPNEYVLSAAASLAHRMAASGCGVGLYARDAERVVHLRPRRGPDAVLAAEDAMAAMRSCRFPYSDVLLAASASLLPGTVAVALCSGVDETIAHVLAAASRALVWVQLMSARNGEGCGAQVRRASAAGIPVAALIPSGMTGWRLLPGWPEVRSGHAV